MHLPRRRFLRLAAALSVAPAMPRIARAQAYPSKPVRIVTGFSSGSAMDTIARLMRAMADGKGRPVVRRRESRRRRRQSRHRGGRALPAGRLHAPRLRFAGRDQRHALRQAQLQFPPRHHADRGDFPRAECSRGASLVSGEDDPGIHRLHQSQSRQGRLRFGRRRQRVPHVRRAVHGDDRARSWCMCRIAASLPR